MDLMSGQGEAWKRVWELINERRKELGWSWTRLQNEADVSQRTLTKMRKDGIGLVSDAKRSSLCRALGWSIDSIDRIIAGGEPIIRSAEGNTEIERRARAAVQAERERRGWTFTDTEIGGYPGSMWEEFESGGPLHVDMQYAIAIAFVWPDNWIRYIAEGRDPNVPQYEEFESLVSRVEELEGLLARRVAVNTVERMAAYINRCGLALELTEGIADLLTDLSAEAMTDGEIFAVLQDYWIGHPDERPMSNDHVRTTPVTPPPVEDLGGRVAALERTMAKVERLVDFLMKDVEDEIDEPSDLDASEGDSSG